MPQDPAPGHENSVVRRHPDALASPRGTEDAGEARLRPGNHVTRRHTPKLFPPEQTRLLLLAAPARGAHAPRRFLRPCAPAAGGLGGPRGASGGARRARAPPPPCATHLRAAAPAWHSAARRPPHLGGAGPPRAPRPRRGLQLASPAREGAAAGGGRAAGRAGRGGPGRAGCLFVCSPRSLAEPSDHMPRGENMGFAQWRQDSGLTLTAGSIY